MSVIVDTVVYMRLEGVPEEVEGVRLVVEADLLVDLPPHTGLFGLGRLQAELEAILGAKMDLVPASDLKPAVRARAERDLVAL
jgi:hypothetical protein